MLIAKEWLSFGHRFKERIGHTMLPGAKRSDHISPVFLQWLDCVWQLVSKFPCHFEFNTRMLLAIADNLFSWCVACIECARVLGPSLPTRLPAVGLARSWRTVNVNVEVPITMQRRVRCLRTCWSGEICSRRRSTTHRYSRLQV